MAMIFNFFSKRIDTEIVLEALQPGEVVSVLCRYALRVGDYSWKRGKVIYRNEKRLLPDFG